MFIIFDTETTGLPKNWQAPMKDLDNWPRVIQLAWGVYSEKGELQHSVCSLITPDGWEVPEGKFWVDNGYSTLQCQAEGKPIATLLGLFVSDALNCHSIVAHNISYDYNVLGAEAIRAGVKTGIRLKQYCTKELSTNYCRLRAKYGGSYKWPNLSELHNKLFGCDFDGAHDAMQDVAATAKCFFELKRLKVITD